MSQWNVLEEMWKHSKSKLIDIKDSWDIHYEFNMLSGETKYLFFEFGETEVIHPTTREVVVIDVDNQII